MENDLFDLDNITEYIPDVYLDEKTYISTMGLVTLIYSQTIIKESLDFFYRQTKEVLDEELSNKIRDIVGKKDIYIYILDTPSFSTILSLADRIIVSSAFKKLLNRRELIAMLLHEYGHYKEMHVYKIKGFYNPLKTSFAMLATAPILFGMNSDDDNYWPKLSFRMFVTLFLNMGLDIATNIAVYRKFDRVADNYAIKYGYGADMISALNKLANHLKELSCDKSSEDHAKCLKRIDMVFRKSHYKSSEPTLYTRIENIQRDMVIKNIKGSNPENLLNDISKTIRMIKQM